MKIYLCDGVKYRPVLDDDLKLFIVSVSYLDKAWKQGSRMYVPRGMGDLTKRKTNQNILKSGDCICPPEVFIAPEGLMVVDGRHRLSALRDMGKKVIVVSSRSELPLNWAKKIAP